jgi:transcriptional regulator with XRE-family HTH domain
LTDNSGHIGARIRYWRRRRGGMSQETLAGLAGVTRAYISLIEAGRRAVERRSTIVALAGALNVSVADLLGQPGDTTDPTRLEGQRAVPRIRTALLEIEEGEQPPPTRTVEELSAALNRVDQLRNEADHTTIANLLPELLVDAAGHGGNYLTRASYNTASCLRVLGYRDLALSAARLSLRAAQDLDDPAWLGAARFAYVQAMPIEAAALSGRVADRAIGELQGHAADRRVRQVLGQIHLSAAFTSAVAQRSDDAAAHLRAAEEEAQTLGDPPDGLGFHSMGFGPTNVTLWRMSVLAERGEFRRVIEQAPKVDPAGLRISIRHQSYWLDYGRALAASGRADAQARAAFMRAEAAAPIPFSINPMARDIVRAMVNRARHDAVPPDLRALATRLGVDAS